ncbi:MAG: LEA type 2 family protein [Gammaproteobacteria bacterium]|nr:LEA type 2 family protein [Gammaproteobacteria bacterium]
MHKLKACSSTLLVACLLAACASTGNVIRAPDVRLTNVQMTAIEFSGQTFLLGFDVSNPNPFPLPISAVSYGVELDGYRFASGRTNGGFTVPATGDGEFAISVELDLLKTAPQLLYIVSDGVKRSIPYALKGELGVDIPLTKPVSFATTGEIRLQAPRR